MTPILPLIDYLVIGFYLLLVLGIGFYFSRFMKGGKDFFIGGNLVPWWAAGISLYMTSFSAWMFTGAASFVYNTGWFGLLFFTSQPIGFFIGFQISAVRWRRTRITSPVEYVQTRFNKNTHLLLSIILVLSMMYWPAHHLASLSKICAPTLFPNSMSAIDIMIVVSAVIILIYSFSGGFWAVCITDVVQFLILFVVCIVLIPTCFLSGDVGSIGEFLNKIPPIHFEHVIRGKTTYTHWYLVGFLASKVFGLAVGDKAQRFYSVKDEKAAKRVGWLGFALFMTGPIIFGIPPLFGKVLWPDVSQLQYFSSITKPDENIYIAVVLRYMPTGVVGIFLSAMMAASMSALDSVWNTVSSIVSVDIYKNIFKPHASDTEVLRVGRITIVGLFIVAIVMALMIIHSSYGVFTFSNIFFGLTGVPVAIPLLLGILVKNISTWSGFTSIIAGTLMASVARFILQYNLGPQYLVTIAITLLFIFPSVWWGNLYCRNRRLAWFMSVVFGVGLWLYFLLGNTNPNLSISTYGASVKSGWLIFFASSHFWATMAAFTFTMLTYFSGRAYARTNAVDTEQVTEFFEKIKTPINAEIEVLKGKNEITVFPLVGGIAMTFALLSLAILLAPTARTKVGVNVAMSLLLFGFGLIMFLSDKRVIGRLKK